jgi:hypothetical protein
MVNPLFALKIPVFPGKILSLSRYKDLYAFGNTGNP